MILRPLIIAGLIYVAYRLIRARLFGGGVGGAPVDKRASGEIDEVMIKDPQCGVYFPGKDGVRLSWKGGDLYFCSDACRDKFKATQ